MLTAKTKIRIRLLAMLLVLGASAAPASAQSSAPSSVWDGVYTDAQAAHGARLYSGVCAMCHGQVLEGSGEAPPLVGRFIPDWGGTMLTDLYDKIHDTMPLFAPGTLKPDDTSDILAFILQSNGFPAGGITLSAGDSLKSIALETAKPAAKTKVKKSR